LILYDEEEHIIQRIKIRRLGDFHEEKSIDGEELLMIRKIFNEKKYETAPKLRCCPDLFPGSSILQLKLFRRYFSLGYTVNDFR